MSLDEQVCLDVRIVILGICDFVGHSIHKLKQKENSDFTTMPGLNSRLTHTAATAWPFDPALRVTSI